MDWKMNSVESLLTYPFTTRSTEEKFQVKELGRPTPDLVINQKAKGAKNCMYNRRFRRTVYNTSWICGCDLRNALFCFPCLIFGNITSLQWVKTGVTDLGHINNFIEKHKNNVRHINNMLQLSSFGKANIATQLSRRYNEATTKHNRQVEKNRYMLSKMIDCIKFCGAFELALDHFSEIDDSENPDVLLGLMDFVVNVDCTLREQIESNQMIKNASKAIRNSLLDCMLEVYHEFITKEIKEADFVALILEETIANDFDQPQLALVYRYERKGEPYEIFWGFFKPRDHTIDAVSECILNEVNPLFKDGPHKIIAQTLGGSVMSCATAEFQGKIKAYYPNAHVIHCYAQQLNEIIEHAASRNHSARLFFQDMSAFTAYFSRSPQRLSSLESVMAHRIPSCSSMGLNLKLRTVNAIYDNRESLKQRLITLEKIPDKETCHEAVSLRRCLEDEEFLNWLTFFSKIMPQVQTLSNQIQAKHADAIKVKSAVTHFIEIVNQARNSTRYFQTEAVLSNKKSIMEDDVCDKIIYEICHRFGSLSHLDLANLLNFPCFPYFCSKFPERELDAAVNNYSMLNKKKLKTELQVIYERRYFRNIKGIIPLLQHMLSNNLQETFWEVTKLLKILITTPMIAEPDRCFSTLQKIRTFLRNTVSQERFTALAVLSVEKKFLSGIEGFNAKVINKFCNKKDCNKNFNFQH